MTSKRWWEKTTIYQIYPRSFKDSSGDGIGDLGGIVSRLDYIKDLGFETLWISPFFSSPQGDWGYDVSDYYSIAPEYGDLADAEALIREVHDRGMRILFDLVMNHTSIEHAWFQESRSSRDHPKRDWYIWRDGRGRRPPNNWKAIPGGPAWHHDHKTGQWYYASFLPFQPDLNFRHPAVRQAMLDVVRYWLDKGIDGFRIDIFHAIYEDEALRDNPFALSYVPTDHKGGFFQRWQYNLNRPETFALARELRALVDGYTPDRLLLGELFGDDDTLKRYLGDQLDGLNLVFLWDLLKLKADARFLRTVIRHHETHYPAPYTPVYVLGNHDQKRSLSKIGGDRQGAKLLALLQFTARGVPVTYYGEEIGMEDGRFPARAAKDPLGQRYAWVPGFLVDLLDLYVNRDGCRTPMQWDDSANAGFCPAGATPWLPVHPNYETINVAAQRADEDSLLNVYRELLRLRRQTPALQEGTLHLVEGADVGRDLLIYRREWGEENVLVAINFGRKSRTFRNPGPCRRLLFGIRVGRSGDRDRITLPPYSGMVLGSPGGPRPHPSQRHRDHHPHKDRGQR